MNSVEASAPSRDERRVTHRGSVRSTVARAAAVALVAAAGCAATSGPAMAGAPVIENEHFVSVRDSHLEQEEHADFCPEITFPVLWEGRVSANFQIRTRGLDGPEYYADRIVAANRYTNTENGKYLESQSRFRSADQQLSLDGDVLTVRWAETVNVRITSSEEGYLGQESGHRSGYFVVDLNDLENEEDDVVLVDDVKDLTGHSDMGGVGEFCDDLVAYLS